MLKKLCNINNFKKKKIDLNGKRIILRVDFNVPIKKQKNTYKIIEDFKIKQSLKTIEFLLENKAIVILISHLGRPQKIGNPLELTLKPVSNKLKKIINKKVEFFNDPFSEKQAEKIKNLKPCSLALLENIRFYKEEEKNDSFFAKKLAEVGDFYVNDAFAVCHRAHASIEGITKYLPSYAGFLLENEVSNLNKILLKPKSPFIVLLGGAKIFTKIKIIKTLSKKANKILLGGALINNFYYNLGYKIGSSLINKKELEIAKKIIKNKKIILPKDVIVGNLKTNKKHVKIVDINEKNKYICTKDEAILDIGPKTIKKYASILKTAKTITWNGPMGYFEIPQFSHGSIMLARVIASRSSGRAFGVVGGGETVKCLNKTLMSSYVDHVSTGGGAMLEFLGGKKMLPGLKPLFRLW